MVVMYLLLLVGILKSNGFDIVEEDVNGKIVSLHNDYGGITSIEGVGLPTITHPPAHFLNIKTCPTWKPLRILPPIETYGRNNSTHP